MKKFITAGVLVAGSFMAQSASAATMECYVDTQAFDQYTPNHCFAIVWGHAQQRQYFGLAVPISLLIK